MSCLIAACMAIVGGCGSSVVTGRISFADGTPGIEIEGIAPCVPHAGEPLRLEPAEPVVVLVHGCNASLGRFQGLSEVFELHGQQTACFYYNDRARLRSSAKRLARALTELQRHMARSDITVFGHSQGGLVARAALTGEPGIGTPAPAHASTLVTVSAPFGGIEASKDCGKRWLHGMSLGMTLGVCRAVAGAKWREIHPRSNWVTDPVPMVGGVAQHVHIVTDERDTCRRRSPQGECIEDDFVFSLHEQSNRRIERDGRVRSAEIRAGHGAVVGSRGTRPDALVEVLQRTGILKPTPPDQQFALARLLSTL